MGNTKSTSHSYTSKFNWSQNFYEIGHHIHHPLIRTKIWNIDETETGPNSFIISSNLFRAFCLILHSIHNSIGEEDTHIQLGVYKKVNNLVLTNIDDYYLNLQPQTSIKNKPNISSNFQKVRTLCAGFDAVINVKNMEDPEYKSKYGISLQIPLTSKCNKIKRTVKEFLSSLVLHHVYSINIEKLKSFLETHTTEIDGKVELSISSNEDDVLEELVSLDIAKEVSSEHIGLTKQYTIHSLPSTTRKSKSRNVLLSDGKKIKPRRSLKKRRSIRKKK